MIPIAGRRSRSGGFTLIELMITVAVIAILAAIAYPAYKDSILKGKRAQGRAALLELMTQQERYLTQNNTYLRFAVNATSSTDAGSNAVSPIPFKTLSGDNASSAAFRLGARACNSGADTTLRSCVQVFAQPIYTDPAVTELTIMSTGAKSCTATNTNLCWP